MKLYIVSNLGESAMLPQWTPSVGGKELGRDDSQTEKSKNPVSSWARVDANDQRCHKLTKVLAQSPVGETGRLASLLSLYPAQAQRKWACVECDGSLPVTVFQLQACSRDYMLTSTLFPTVIHITCMSSRVMLKPYEIHSSKCTRWVPQMPS